MVKLENILNKRFSTRNLSDSEFIAVLPSLARDLEAVDFHTNYTEDELRNDWKKLCNWKSDGNTINSTSRLGLKLCEHYHPNFYDIKNAAGQSFRSLWKKENLEKILVWNRKCHSTPYLSELKRGIYFCCGLPKSTMFRPQIMKLACQKWQPRVVLDPCAGWGGRMLGAVASGAHYIAFEPNTTTYKNLLSMAEFLDIKTSITLICDDARNMQKYDIPNADLVLTSPPYFDLEIYSDEVTQSITGSNDYDSWAEDFLKVVIKLSTDKLSPGGVSCWNVGKVRGRDMENDVEKYHAIYGFGKIDTLAVNSSKRQTNQNQYKNTKNSDSTIVYSKI